MTWLAVQYMYKLIHKQSSLVRKDFHNSNHVFRTLSISFTNYTTPTTLGTTPSTTLKTAFNAKAMLRTFLFLLLYRSSM